MTSAPALLKEYGTAKVLPIYILIKNNKIVGVKASKKDAEIEIAYELDKKDNWEVLPWMLNLEYFGIQLKEDSNE